MKVIKIKTKYGIHDILLDDEDYEKFKDFNWKITKHKLIRNGDYFIIYRNLNFFEKKELGIKSVLLSREVTNTIGDKNIQIDHKDHNTFNNQKNNLRKSTPSQNSANKRNYSKISMYKGVVTNTNKTKFYSVVGKDYKVYKEGPFFTEIEAAINYNKMATLLHKDFAFLNKIPENMVNQISGI